MDENNAIFDFLRCSLPLSARIEFIGFLPEVIGFLPPLFVPENEVP